jgi:hypothetical protein
LHLINEDFPTFIHSRIIEVETVLASRPVGGEDQHVVEEEVGLGGDDDGAIFIVGSVDFGTKIHRGRPAACYPEIKVWNILNFYS